MRESTASAFLDPAKKRANLTVLTKAHVERILFEGKRAVGVTYRRKGQQNTLFASREIIVSAGSVNSPALLEHSGVGNQQVLENAGITPVHINPNVGEHLQDHIAVNYVYESHVPTLNDELYSWLSLIHI